MGKKSQEIKKALSAQERTKACTREIELVLKKYDCTMVVHPSEHYGQPIYTPAIVPVRK